MSARKYRVKILERYCKGCALCVDVCAERKLFINPHPNKQGLQVAAETPDVDCTGCARCATICPDAAIEIYRLVASAQPVEKR